MADCRWTTGRGGVVLLFVSGGASAPSARAERLFDSQTNSLPRVVVVTKVVPTTIPNTIVGMQTNRVTESEVWMVPVTNETVVVSFRTNEVVATNWVAGTLRRYQRWGG
jgi:hypothetical protein